MIELFERKWGAEEAKSAVPRLKYKSWGRKMKKLLILLIALLLVGCSKNETVPTQESTIDPEWAWLLEEPTGPEATKVVLELSQESLTESLEFYFLVNDGKSQMAYMDAIVDARSFAVTAFKREGDVVTAEVTVTMPDLYAVITGMDPTACRTAEELDAALRSAIQGGVPVEKQITVRFAEGEDRWLPVMDQTVADAFYGGLITYLQETTEGEA